MSPLAEGAAINENALADRFMKDLAPAFVTAL